ncbi:MAG: DUF4406 domain-containing protein [Deltaproteobacteria bacterium]|nr:DUF4406 domain-containing protein [Deltaproteobacteria bacterium]
MQLIPKGFRNKEELLQAYLDFLKDTDPLKVCYISGPISPGNGNSVEENIRNLNRYAAEIDTTSNYDIVIDPSAIGDLEAMGYSRDDALYVWCSLLSSGLIGVITMVPGWEHSGGATIEHETAREQGLKIIYL